MRSLRQRLVLSRGPFRSGSSFCCLSFRILRYQQLTPPSTSVQLISVGLRAESTGRVMSLVGADVGQRDEASKLRIEFMERTVKTDVLIIGAGPTGLSFAGQLL